MQRMNVKPELLSWAQGRSMKSTEMLEKKFPKLKSWLEGELSPTFKQLEIFAKATYTPIGFFFLQEPPIERVPIPDFRKIPANTPPSPDMLDTIYICQQRQEWYRDFENSMQAESLSFVGSASVRDDVVKTAADIRDALNFNMDERGRMRAWIDVLRSFIRLAEDIGVLVMVSGVVGSDNRRKLKPQEFRGFALVDNLAPLVFINGGDSKSAQMFTLAHELAHVWLGQSALSNDQAKEPSSHEVEKWCNQVAAELLVPLELFRHSFDKKKDLQDEMKRLARLFKVSTLVILRRIHEIGGLTRAEFWDAYDGELQRLPAAPKASGGNFYLTQAARVSKRFARALIISTLGGQTLYRDAFRMLGFSKLSAFRKLGHSLGVM